MARGDNLFAGISRRSSPPNRPAISFLLTFPRSNVAAFHAAKKARIGSPYKDSLWD
jgi:hypothetical protein